MAEEFTKFDYKNYPHLAMYIDRCGARPKNFRRFVVEEEGEKYNRINGKIDLFWKDNQLQIKASEEEHQPSEHELKLIRSDFNGITSDPFPKSSFASQAQVMDLVDRFEKGQMYFVFVDRSKPDYANVVMVQQRIEIRKTNKKAYVPWTYFNGEGWISMEPDGRLPIWKPETPSKTGRIMLHEGAKAAKYVDWLINGKEREAEELRRQHPWFDDLKDYEHWGIIGGAFAMGDADYESIRRENPVEVVYICDNDWYGKRALRDVSRGYGGKLKAVMVDEGKFPSGWDMADPFLGEESGWWPTIRLEDGSEVKRYNGPSLRSLYKSATWATRTTVNQATGRRVQIINPDFAQEWYHCVKPEVFVHKDYPHRIHTPAAFENEVASYTDYKEVSELLKRDNVQKTGYIKYDPSDTRRITTKDNITYLNTFLPSQVKPEKGDVSKFLAFMEHLIPDEHDRHLLMCWCATLVVKPEVKINYGVLLISETQGVGKSTLAYIVSKLVGDHNASKIKEEQVLDQKYNYWQAEKRLAVIDEIYQGHSNVAYNKLKDVITAVDITVSKKYQDEYKIDNWLHIFATSNERGALKIDEEDRRWLLPGVREREKKSVEYWEDLHDWLDCRGGLQFIAYYFHDFLKEKRNVVSSGHEAPMTRFKAEVIADMKSPGVKMIHERMKRLKEKAAEDNTVYMVIDKTLQELVITECYEGVRHDKVEKVSTLKKEVKKAEVGWSVCKARVKVREWGIIEGGPEPLVTDSELARTKTPNELNAMGFKPLTLQELQVF